MQRLLVYHHKDLIHSKKLETFHNKDNYISQWRNVKCWRKVNQNLDSTALIHISLSSAALCLFFNKMSVLANVFNPFSEPLYNQDVRKMSRTFALILLKKTCSRLRTTWRRLFSAVSHYNPYCSVNLRDALNNTAVSITAVTRGEI